MEVKRMASSPKSNDHTPTAGSNTDSKSRPVSEHILKAIYVVNKHAKKFAGLAEKNYHLDKQNRATINSYKKQALYELKAHVLRDLVPQANDIQEHRINGRNYYCLYFTDYSFHVPANTLLIEPNSVSADRTLEDFTTSTTKNKTKQFLEDALKTLQTEFGHNANESLPEQYVAYGPTPYFIGWTILQDIPTTR
jgi:hypothetical protein